MYPQDTHWYEELFDAVYQFVGILDTHGKVIRANQAVRELTGLDQSALIDNPLWELPWAALSRANKRDIKRAVNKAAKGEFNRIELEIRPRNTPVMSLDFTFKPVLDEMKTVKFVIAEGRDISVYKRTSEALYQSKARLATIFEKAGLGIVIEGPDGKIMDCNPAFLAMLGYQLEQILQHDYLEITHPLDRPTSSKLFNELVKGKRESYSMEKRYLDKEGQPVWVSINTSLVHTVKRGSGIYHRDGRKYYGPKRGRG